jgi:hypothetical protein
LYPLWTTECSRPLQMHITGNPIKYDTRALP